MIVYFMVLVIVTGYKNFQEVHSPGSSDKLSAGPVLSSLLFGQWEVSVNHVTLWFMGLGIISWWRGYVGSQEAWIGSKGSMFISVSSNQAFCYQPAERLGRAFQVLSSQHGILQMNLQWNYQTNRDIFIRVSHSHWKFTSLSHLKIRK